MPTSPADAATGLDVVELWDGTSYLGSVRRRGQVLTVKSGFVGRPAVLHLDEVMSITPASGHPDVEVAEDPATTWLRTLALEVLQHDGCEGCRRMAAAALEDVGLLHLLPERGLADPR